MVKETRQDYNPPSDLLTTKLLIPVRGSNIVRRKRLTNLLRRIIERRVTLIVSPAGYGKTTLLVDWIETEQLPNQRIAWISLDETDNTPVRFWSYLASSIQKAHQSFRINQQFILQQYNPQDPAQLNPLINEIARIPYQVCIVLDDFQEITNEQIHRSMEYLIDHQPGNLHLIFSSRVAPRIPLTRLRANKQLLELTSKDLSFNEQEAASFFSEVMDLKIEPEQIVKMLNATEGWIAGLQLAALSLQSRQDLKHVINDFSSDSSIYIIDYLTEEVLNQQDEDIKNFLLKTSILSELTAPLCDALLDRKDSKKILYQIERSNLFVASLDQDQHRLSYHPLFASALRVQLERTHPDLVPHLHRKAYSWLKEHTYFDEAVSHALAVGDIEDAVEIIDSCAMRAITKFDLPTLVHWIGRFSDELISQHPRLGIYYAVASYYLGRLDLVEKELQVIEQVLGRNHQLRQHSEDDELIRWILSALRAAIRCVQDDYLQGISDTLHVLESTPKNDLYITGFLYHYIAYAYDSADDLDAAIDAFEKGCRWAIAHDMPLEYVSSRCEIARFRKNQGLLQDAEKEYLKTLDFAHQKNLNFDIISQAMSGLGEIALERNDIKAATEWMNPVTVFFSGVELTSLAWFCSNTLCSRLMNYYLCIQDHIQTHNHYHKTKRYLQENRQLLVNLFSEVIESQAQYWLKFGKQKDPKIFFQKEISFLKGANYFILSHQLISAKAYISQQNPAEAIPILKSIEVKAQESGRGEILIETLILLAISHTSTDDNERAQKYFQRAIQIAAPQGYIRIFLDQGEMIKPLLLNSLSMYSDDPSSKKGDRHYRYIHKLLAELEAEQSKNIYPAQKSTYQSSIVSPSLGLLSQREIEVYQLLEVGVVPKEIATTLNISINTVKAHIKSIYRKLDAHTRKDMFRRAKGVNTSKK